MSGVATATGFVVCETGVETDGESGDPVTGVETFGRGEPVFRTSDAEGGSGGREESDREADEDEEEEEAERTAAAPAAASDTPRADNEFIASRAFK